MDYYFIFLRKILDSILFGAICHYSITFIKGEDASDISDYILIAALALAILFSIIHAVRIAIPANRNIAFRVYNIEPDAINVKRTVKSDINVKVDRWVKRIVKNALIIIIGSAVFGISLSASGYDLERQKGSWIPAVVLVVECVSYNFYVCSAFKGCRCPICKRHKAIKLVSKKLLEKKIGNWTEKYEGMSFEERPVIRVKFDNNGLESRYEDIAATPVIRTQIREYHNVRLGRHSKLDVCRFCGQRFVYDDEEFERI